MHVFSRWIPETQERLNQGCIKMLVGNKSDSYKRSVELEERGFALAQDLGIPYFTVSAKDGSNVKEAFEKLIETCLSAVRTNQLQARKGLTSKALSEQLTYSSADTHKRFSWCSLI